MRFHLLVLIVAMQTMAQDVPPAQSVLSGIVTSIDGEPLPGARVVLGRDPSHSLSATPPDSVGKVALAGPDGRFQFNEVAQGSYLLVAEVDGYVKQPYGGRPGYFGLGNGAPRPLESATVQVTKGSRITGLDFQMTRSSSIVGWVSNAAGNPVSGTLVYALRWTYVNATQNLEELGRATTSGSGSFRIEGLAPGEYYICAVPSFEDNRPGYITRTAQPTFFPNALRRQDALAVNLTADSTETADIRLREDPLVSISGTVVGADRDPAFSGATVLLMRAPDTPPVGGILPVRNYAARTFAGPTGEFIIRGVAPGPHNLVALGGNAPSLNASSEGRRSTSSGGQSVGPGEGSGGLATIIVGEEEVQGVTIPLRPGGEVTLQVTMDTGSFQDWVRELLERSSTTVPSGEARRMGGPVPEVTLIPAIGVSTGGVFAARPSDYGRLTQKLSPGRYFVEIRGRNDLYYLKSIRLGSEDLTHKPFEYRGGTDAELEIVLGTDGGKVTGTVTDESGNPAPGARVTLWPREIDFSQRNGGAQVASSTHDGSFQFRLVAPGEYDVIAFEALPDPGIAEYPAFVARMASRGKRVKVDPNQTATVSVPAVPEQESDRVIRQLP